MVGLGIKAGERSESYSTLRVEQVGILFSLGLMALAVILMAANIIVPAVGLACISIVSAIVAILTTIDSPVANIFAIVVAAGTLSTVFSTARTKGWFYIFAMAFIALMAVLFFQV